MKYIIIDTGTVEIPLIFPEVVEHEQIGRKFEGKVISAGYTKFKNGRWTAGGESISLKVKARPEEDEFILNQAMRY